MFSKDVRIVELDEFVLSLTTGLEVHSKGVVDKDHVVHTDFFGHELDSDAHVTVFVS
jgi:hypothetical protein